MDDEDVAVGHALHLLRHGVTEHPLDLARLARPDDDETGIVRLGYLDDRRDAMSPIASTSSASMPKFAQQPVRALELGTRAHVGRRCRRRPA